MGGKGQRGAGQGSADLQGLKNNVVQRLYNVVVSTGKGAVSRGIHEGIRRPERREL